MKNRNSKSIIKKILIIIQVLIVIAPMILEYYTKGKMGVARYLSYKDMVFSKGIFSDKNLNIFEYVFIVLLIVSFILIIYNIKNNNKDRIKDSVEMCILYVVGILYIVFKDKIVLKIDVYYYFFISIIVVIGLQVMKLRVDR